MFPNVKLPHWLSLLVSLAAAIVAWLMARSAAGDLVLPAAVLGALPLVNSVLGMLSPAVSPTTNAVAAKMAMMRAARIAGSVLFLCVVLGGVWACQACTPQQVSKVETVSIDATRPRPSRRSAGSRPSRMCSKVLAAHHAAELREQFDAGSVRP